MPALTLSQRNRLRRTFLASFFVLALTFVFGIGFTRASEPPPTAQVANLSGQTKEQADAKSAGCVSCHLKTDSATMHPTDTVQLGCIDCHGGNAEVKITAGQTAGSAEYEQVKLQAHVQPRSSENRSGDRPSRPGRYYAEWLREPQEFIQFVNPGDLRVASRTCGSSGCHSEEVPKVRSSMMTRGAMLWGAALYNNGAFPIKNPHFGESYNANGEPQRLQTWPPPTAEETKSKGILTALEPLARWETA